ncbi:hypothetical protein ACN4EK_25485 [Pantanalinema rosaneae CENA516]|uniref:hypothetical protein n=1 Tax=Pantanalinema rosaneae TaxID=1620701 RepID=UPI003D6E0967
MLIGIIVFSSLGVLILAEYLLPKPGKTPEQELGEAITKYLSKGVKVRIEQNND